MFESKTDFDFDDGIFSDTIITESSQSTTYKRPIINETSHIEIKKRCSNFSHFPPPYSTEASAQNFSTNTPRKTPLKEVVPRKFPGPAGILPERKNLNIDIMVSKTVCKEKSEENVDMDSICSQMSVKAFQEEPWELMHRDFRSLSSKYNIAWIKSKAKSDKLINQKAPFLAVIIQSVECLNLKTVRMILKDTTGEIDGTIVNDLYEDYNRYLTVGSVIILKQCGVLTTDHGSTTITITANNLVTIYTGDEGNKVKVTRVQQYFYEDFIKTIDQVKAKYKMTSSKNNLDMFVDFGLQALCDIKWNGTVTPIQKLTTRTTSTKMDSNAAENWHSGSPVNNLSTNHCVETNKSKGGENPVKILNINHCVEINKSKSSGKFNFKAHLKQNVNNESLNVKKDNNLQETNDKSIVKCSQISIVSDNVEHNAILQNVFEGIDAGILFDDF